MFDLILYVPANNFSVMLEWVFLGQMCLANGHNTVTPVRLEPAAPQSRAKHSTTEPLCFRKRNEQLPSMQSVKSVKPFFVGSQKRDCAFDYQKCFLSLTTD